MRNLVAQNFLENGINNPFLYFPTFYSFKALMEREQAPLSAAWHNYTCDLTVYCVYWCAESVSNPERNTKCMVRERGFCKMVQPQITLCSPRECRNACTYDVDLQVKLP